MYAIGRMMMCKNNAMQAIRQTESCTNRRQHVDVQEQCNADLPVVDPNPTVMGNMNNRNQNLSSNPIINESQSFLSEQLTEE